MSGRERAAGLPVEIVAVWLLCAVVAVEVFVTYARLPARELYHVTGSGLVGGASRALVFLNFPVALIAIAVLAVLEQRLRGRLRGVALVAMLLSAAVVWPGVVSQGDLDARPVNAIAAVGVGVAVALTVVAWAAGGLGRLGRRRGDRIRIALAAALLIVAAPWVAADLGFFLTGVPLLGWLFQTQPPFPPAVHHGHHHGMDGTLLTIAALLLSRTLPTLPQRPMRALLAGYLALMFCYGIGNVANDFWTEQVFKRGWTRWQIPNVLTPRASVAWGVIVAAAVIVYVLSAVYGDRPTD